jgi:hypothetical protein
MEIKTYWRLVVQIEKVTEHDSGKAELRGIAVEPGRTILAISTVEPGEGWQRYIRLIKEVDTSKKGTGIQE